MSKEVKRYLAIDAFRGIAAIAVVLFHFTISEYNGHSPLRFGSAGVDLFFIISGFVISMSLSKAPTVWHFVISRLSRLFPTYWAGVAVSFIIIMLHHVLSDHAPAAIEHPWRMLAANLTMLQYFLGVADVEPPYWTMTVELVFYVFMGVCMFSRVQRHTIMLSAALCVLVGASSFFIDSNYSIKSVFVSVPLLYHFPLFFIGMIFYQRFMHGGKFNFYALLILGWATQMWIFPHTWRTCKYVGHFEYAVLLGLFMLGFELFCRQRLQCIVNPVTLFLGRISFPLYLTHQYLTINLIIPYMRWKYEMSLFTACAFFALPSAILLAWLIHVVVERRLSDVMKNYLTRCWIHP